MEKLIITKRAGGKLLFLRDNYALNNWSLHAEQAYRYLPHDAKLMLATYRDRQPGNEYGIMTESEALVYRVLNA